MVKRVKASRLVRFMSSGRTSPALCECVDENDAEEEYVVKLFGHAEMTKKGMIIELVCSLLAQYFQIEVPEPAIVEISKSFADAVAALGNNRSEVIQKSVGPNFGTKLLRPAATIPRDFPLDSELNQSAGELFAFDALIQNPDRCSSNPNVFATSSKLVAFDHEMGLSFLRSILGTPTPWDLSGETYLNNHVFFEHLKKHVADLDLGEFQTRLRGLPDELLEELGLQIPEEWGAIPMEKVVNHMRLLRENADNFIENVYGVLS